MSSNDKSLMNPAGAVSVAAHHTSGMVSAGFNGLEGSGMEAVIAGKKVCVRLWDSCGSIRVNMTVDGHLEEQHMFQSHETVEAADCYAKMQQGVRAAIAIIGGGK
jgi:hypothetical protein